MQKKNSIIFGITTLFIILFFVLLIGKSYKHPYYLKFRTSVIKKIELTKNSYLFKSYFIFIGERNAKKIFQKLDFKKNKAIILKKYLLNEDQINHSEISFEELEKINNQNVKKSVSLKNYNKIFENRINQSVYFNFSIPSKKTKIFRVNYYGINHYGIFEQSNNNNVNKKLIIYNQGHLGNPYNKEYFIKMKNKFLNNGFDIFSLGMLGRGVNYEAEVKYPNTSEKDRLLTYNHENIKYFYDNNFPNKKPLSIFLSGNYFLIKNLLKSESYDEVIFVGVSGGGMYGKIFSSLFDQISSTYIFNGSSPCFLQIFVDTKGDWENCEKSLYSSINTWQFYRMASNNKKLILVYNKKDKCCYRDPTASIMFEIGKRLNDNNFKVVTYSKSKFHGVNIDILFNDFELK